MLEHNQDNDNEGERSLDVSTRNLVRGWVDALSEPINEEVEAIQQYDGITEDSWASGDMDDLHLQVGDGLNLSSFDVRGAGAVERSEYDWSNNAGMPLGWKLQVTAAVVRIQTLVRGFLGRVRARVRRQTEGEIREVIRNETMYGNLPQEHLAVLDAVDMGFEDSFASDENGYVEEELVDINALNVAVNDLHEAEIFDAEEKSRRVLQI